jgi:DNA-binding LytR/AlgR family response regulator
MKFHIAIVEDDDSCAETLVEYVHRYALETGEDFEVTRFQDGDGIVENYAAVYDVIFLDIQMKIMDGMETAKYIRKLDKEVIIVFVTNMAQYAIKGYAVDALNFLLKPVPYFAFSQELKRCIAKLRTKEKHFLMVSTENGLFRFSSDEILYIEVLNHRLYIHTKTEELKTYGTIKEMETKLPKTEFYRCNNCYLVNLAYVSGVKDGMAIVEGKELPISRAKKKGFMGALATYYSRRSNG